MRLRQLPAGTQPVAWQLSTRPLIQLPPAAELPLLLPPQLRGRRRREPQPPARPTPGIASGHRPSGEPHRGSSSACWGMRQMRPRRCPRQHRRHRSAAAPPQCNQPAAEAGRLQGAAQQGGAQGGWVAGRGMRPRHAGWLPAAAAAAGECPICPTTCQQARDL